MAQPQTARGDAPQYILGHSADEEPAAHVPRPLGRETIDPPPTSIGKVARASFIGTTIEWYEFLLFGTAAALVVIPASGALSDRLGRRTVYLVGLLGPAAKTAQGAE